MLYLIRHADAADAARDHERPLSTFGHHQVRQLTEFFRANAALKDVRVFWHSSLVRARETAELLATGLGGRISLRETAGLRPEDPPQAMVAQFSCLEENVAVVGHEPQLSALATLLVSPKSTIPVFLFQKGTVLALEKQSSTWCVSWKISPELLGELKTPRRSGP